MTQLATPDQVFSPPQPQHTEPRLETALNSLVSLRNTDPASRRITIRHSDIQLFYGSGLPPASTRSLEWWEVTRAARESG